MAKTRSLTSDNITFDLEDSVTPSEKVNARKHLRNHLTSDTKPESIGEVAVRINAVSTSLAEADLKAVADLPGLDTIVVPKVNSASDLHFVTDVLRSAAPHRFTPNSPEARPFSLLALIESARAIMDLRSICAATPHLQGLIFAAEDFALDLSLTRTPELTEMLYARSAIVTAARAFQLPSAIDLVCTAYQGQDGKQRLREECQSGKGLGFNGKRTCTPSSNWLAEESRADIQQNVSTQAKWSLPKKCFHRVPMN